MNKTILLTGAAGFVGKHLVRALLDRGYTVRALVRANTDNTALTKMGVQIVTGDLRIKESLYSAFDGVESVVHLASTMKGPWEEYLESTVRGTERLLEIAKERNVRRFVYMSSISVYETLSAKNNFIDENSPLIGAQNIPVGAPPQSSLPSLYERSKIEAEAVVKKFISSGMDGVILRSAVIYGPGGTLLPPRLGLSLGASRYLVIGSGNKKIPLIYVGNLVQGIIAALESPNAKGEIFNLVDDQMISQNDYLLAVKSSVLPKLSLMHLSYPTTLAISNLVGYLLKLIKKPSPFRKVYLNICRRPFQYSNGKAKKLLNWQPILNPYEAMELTINHFKEKMTVLRDADVKLARAVIQLSKPINTTIVGCGVIAKTHIDILRKIQNLKVVGLCDNNLAAAQKMAQDYAGIAAYSDLATMLKEQKADVVHILTPPQSHKDLTLLAARNKCHVFVEKPMAVNAEEARAMQKAAQENNIKLCVGHNHLFDPPMIEARRLVHQGALGQILYAESWYGFNLGENLSSRYMIPGAEKHWAMTIPGKLYQNLIPHPISVLTDVLGYPEEIHAVATSANLVKAMNTDELKVMVKSQQKVGMLTVSLAVNPRYQFLNIYGTEMCIFVDFLNKTLIKHATPKGIPKPIARALFNLGTAKGLTFSTLGSFFKVLTRKFTYFDGTEILIKRFYQSIVEEGEIPVPAEEGVKSMEMMDEIWRQIGNP